MTRKATVFVACLTNLALLACNAEQQASEVRIVGGVSVEASDKEALYTVALVKDNFAFCTGTIVGQRQIMSAAHCFATSGATGVSAAFGVDVNSSQQVRVAQAYVHEAYKSADSAGTDPKTAVNDISLLVLESDIPSGYLIAPVAPPTLAITQGATVVLAGYGVTKTGGRDTGRLLKVDTIMGSENALGKEITVGPTPNRGSCQGDSGGPSFYTTGGVMYVFGVTSRGPDCEEGIGIYTDARQFISWMEGKGAFRVSTSETGANASIPAPTPTPTPTPGDDTRGTTPAPTSPPAPTTAQGANTNIFNQLLSIFGQLQPTTPATGSSGAPSSGAGGGW